MKKIYLMALAGLFGTSLMAQVDVTFRVDMTGQTVSDNGLHVAGNWQAAAGLPGDWDPSTAELTDDNADDIYELTVSLPAGQYEYKFVNDNDWPGVESVPLVNQKGGGNDNRVFAISDWHATDGWVLPAITWGGSAPAGEVAVRLMIDMTNQEVGDLGVHVAGNFSNPEWTPQVSKAFEVANGKYAFVANVAPDASYAYKFLNGNDWGADEAVPDGCAVDGNRQAVVASDDLTTEAYCYGTCDLCAPQTEVTFQVDLSQEGANPDGVSIAGAFQGWSPGATPMTDDDSDGIYEVVLMVDQGLYEFKFVNGNDWDFGESVPPACNQNGNRFVDVGADPITYLACFNQCTEECVLDPDPANITFRVDMNAETVSGDGVFLMGGFTSPAWQGGAVAMSDDDSDGIYEVTLEVDGPADIQYKFVNGDVNTPENEESGDFAAGGCGVDNGIGGFNRTHTRSGEDEILDAVAFNSCQPLSTSDLELGNVNLFPNPTNGVTYLELENPKGFTLRMNIIDITGKEVRDYTVINSTRFELNTTDLTSGLYFLNVVNENSERAVFKLMVE